MRSRNHSKINIKVALSCRFPFQNTAPCCDVKTVPKHNLADAAGSASHGWLLPPWSATSFRDVLCDMCFKKFNDHNLFEILKELIE